MSDKPITIGAALNDALDVALAADPKVILLGEDIADPAGGVFKITKGLSTKYGTDRVRSTPIAEQSIVGAAIGAAIGGYRPVAEIMFFDFVAVAMDQIVNHAAKLRYMSGGLTPVPITIRTMVGSSRFGPQHSQELEAWFMHTPGIKVVAPSTPADAKGLLLSCIFDPDPCLFIEYSGLVFGQKGDVPGGDVRVPIGQAAVRRPGTACTIITYGGQVPNVLKAADALAADGIDAEVIDLRTLVPLDMATVLDSVRKTRRAAVVHGATTFCGPGAELSAQITEQLWGQLDAPVLRLGAESVPLPFAAELKAQPTAKSIAAAIHEWICNPLGLVGRLGAAAQNALEVARFGGLDTGEEPSPYAVVDTQPVYRLRRYFPDDATGPPILLVPPLMVSTEVYDVAPATSAVALLHERGVDPWVVDFGAPDQEQGGLDRTLTDHVLAVSHAVGAVERHTRHDVHLAGYSQGGMFAYQAAAYRRVEGIASIITFGSPVDTSEMIPFGLPEEAIANLVARLVPRWGVPGWVTRTGFRLLDPAKAVRSRVDFLTQLHDRDALLPRESQRRFLEADGWVAYPAPAIAELLQQFVAHNRMLQGGFVIEERLVTLADITCPLLSFVGELDEIAPPKAVRAIRRAAPLAPLWEHPMKVGHFGLVVGSSAAAETWPTVAQWVRWRAGTGQQPNGLTEVTEIEPDDTPVDLATRITHAATLAVEVTANAARAAVGTAATTTDTLRHVVGNTLDQIPRLNRLQGIGPGTRISLGLLLDEQARAKADATFFLFDGRGHTYGDAKRRIDNIVRGLISLGVRQGEHVGVLMGTRPSAVAVVAALSRLGTVVVLMRPDGSAAREVELGQVTRVIADPENAGVDVGGVPILVLGGGGEPRELGFGLTDMERIDPNAVSIPAWYTPNPGRGRDLAFVLFTGHGDSTRVIRITNQRWALSAFGTASAATLTNDDTVYAVTPIHHASGLLTCIGGAVAGGARLALTAEFKPATFWTEVRRYGVTVVSYTWHLARDLVDAPPEPGEQYHPIRLFIGSGMPTALWRRVLERFDPAGVVEFYASSEGEAVLVNLAGHKVGAKGRPLPGSAKVRIARFDLDAGRLIEGADGFAVPCGRDEVGMLLVAARQDRGGLLGTPLRGVFAKNDSWMVTGDLMRRDRDGDFWIVDHVADVIHTAGGAVPSYPIGEALETIDAVDVAVAYEVDGEVVAAVSRRGPEIGKVTGKDLAAAFARTPGSRPAVVRVVDRIPMTTWYRPLKAPLRAEGVPPTEKAWIWRDGAYRWTNARSRST